MLIKKYLKFYKKNFVIASFILLIPVLLLEIYLFRENIKTTTLLAAQQILVCPSNPDSKTAYGLQLYSCYVITPTPTPTPLPTPTLNPSPTPSLAPTVSTPPASNTASSSQSAAPNTASQSAVTGCTQQDIQKLVDSVNPARIQADVDYLSSNPALGGSRHISLPGNPAAVQYVKSQFDAAGIQTTLQPFTSSGGNTVQNVVGTIPGKTTEFYVAGGHVDSISEPVNTAPGADDNATGDAAVMEAARVLKTFSSCLNKSLEFGIWNDEEEGMTGGAEYIKASPGKVIKGYYNYDREGYAQGGAECINFNYKVMNGEPLANKIVEVNTKYNIGLGGAAKESTATNSDHSSFWDAGLSAIWMSECVETPNKHQPTDTSSTVSFTQVTKTAKVLVAALAELAMQ